MFFPFVFVLIWFGFVVGLFGKNNKMTNPWILLVVQTMKRHIERLASQ